MLMATRAPTPGAVVGTGRGSHETAERLPYPRRLDICRIAGDPACDRSNGGTGIRSVHRRLLIGP